MSVYKGRQKVLSPATFCYALGWNVTSISSVSGFCFVKIECCLLLYFDGFNVLNDSLDNIMINFNKSNYRAAIAFQKLKII